MSQTLQSVLCITTNIYLVRVLVVLLHACFSVVSPIRFLLAAIFFSGHPYIGSTTVLPDISQCSGGMQEWVIQIPSIPILVSVLFPSLYLRIKFLLLVCIVFMRMHTKLHPHPVIS